MRSVCPRPLCKSREVIHYGFSRPIACLGHQKQQRWYCKSCKKRFSQSSSTFSFRLKKQDSGLNAKIFHMCRLGISNRQIAFETYVSEHCVRIRLRRLCQQAIAFHFANSQHWAISETIAFDGLENFAGSQYEPNNIQQAIGRDSLFIYDFNFAPLNRKGRMSPWQKNRLAQIESSRGRFNPRAIRVATRDILKRLHARAVGQTLCLVSDEHFQYRRVVTRDLKYLNIEHVTISSKACRNFQNILFSVNHADLLIRQRLAAFKRETIAFSKTPGVMCQKYALFMLHKNYMAPQFSKKHVVRFKAHVQSPAQALGITNRVLKFSDIFGRTSYIEETWAMPRDLRCFWRGEVPKKYHRHKKYLRDNKQQQCA